MKLLLKDGQEFPGVCVASDRPVAGEVVFNTSMSGYIESMTDPSYAGQILVFTYPLLGNYGVPKRATKSNVLRRPFESTHIRVRGIVIQSYIGRYSHHTASTSLAEFCSSSDIPALSGVDTRALTQHLRESGTMEGWLVPDSWTLEKSMRELPQPDFPNDIFPRICSSETQIYGDGRKSVLLVDVGVKENILRSLLARDLTVYRAPWYADLATLAKQTDAIVIGNGPGDPQELAGLIAVLRRILEQFDKPVLGICLGNQLLALAAGASTYKLPYGHRGVNQPVQELGTGRCFITSQNHGYAVDDGSIPEGWIPWFRNLNDNTNEGIRCTSRPLFGVQFHPEGCPGPTDTAHLFDEFVDRLNR
jgi:carbamoyl-phosphate synthase small subunit